MADDGESPGVGLGWRGGRESPCSLMCPRIFFTPLLKKRVKTFTMPPFDSSSSSPPSELAGRSDSSSRGTTVESCCFESSVGPDLWVTTLPESLGLLGDSNPSLGLLGDASSSSSLALRRDRPSLPGLLGVARTWLARSLGNAPSSQRLPGDPPSLRSLTGDGSPFPSSLGDAPGLEDTFCSLETPREGDGSRGRFGGSGEHTFLGFVGVALET